MSKTIPLSIYAVLDRSGSMTGEKWYNAIASFNNYIDELKKNKVKGKVSLIAFDSVYATNHVQSGFASSQNIRLINIVDGVDIKKFEPVDPASISPSGGTPLYDATAKVIDMAMDTNSDKTIVVILTDGEENASTEYDQKAVKAKVKDITARGWEVLFLGANFDVTGYAVNNGLAGTKIRNFDLTDRASTRSTFNSLSTSTMSYVTTGAAIDITDKS